MYEADYSSLLGYLAGSGQAGGRREALVIRRRIRREAVRYAELADWVARFDAWFSKEKIAPGAKVLFWGMNCPEYAVALVACMATGRTAVPIDWRNNGETIEGVIGKTKPRFALMSKYFRSNLMASHKIKVFYLEDLFGLVAKAKLRPKTIGQLVSDKKATNPEKVVEIVFTSGTTGKPKGVVIKQKNLLANLKATQAALPELKNARTVSILPLSHMLEQVAGLLLPLGLGASIYYIPRINSFRLLQAFWEYKPTHLVFVPQLLKIFWNKIEEKARTSGQSEKLKVMLSVASYLPLAVRKVVFGRIHKLFGGCLEFVACGGAPLDKKIGELWTRVGIPVVEGYGATEATAVAAINKVAAPRLGTVGKPIPGVEVNIKDGEIYIKGGSLTAGYFEDKDRTEAAFSSNGYKTGDMGEWDADGNLRIIGREVFKIVLPSGEKVFVEDLEAKLLNDPRVAEACVVAKKQADGDKIHAYVILKKDARDGLKEVISEINSDFESKQQITSYELWPEDDFPRTPTMKVDRRQVYEVANELKEIDQTRSDKGGDALAYQDVVDIVAKISGIERARIKDADILAGDLGIDSLSRVELVAMAEEHLGVVIDESKITAKTSVADVKQLANTAEVFEEVKLPTWQFTAWGEIAHHIATKYLLAPLHAMVIKINYGQKQVPQIQPGSIIIFNHPGILDGVCVVRALLGQNLVKTATNAAANFWTNKTRFAKPLELFVGGMPLYDSGHRLMRVLQTDSDLLDRGYCLLFAPQGGLQTTDLEMPFKPGIGYVVQQLDRPVQIVKIQGYRAIWPVPAKGFENCSIIDFLPPRTGTVTVKISPALTGDWQNMNPLQITNLLEEKYHVL